MELKEFSKISSYDTHSKNILFGMTGLLNYLCETPLPQQLLCNSEGSIEVTKVELKE